MTLRNLRRASARIGLFVVALLLAVPFAASAVSSGQWLYVAVAVLAGVLCLGWLAVAAACMRADPWTACGTALCQAARTLPLGQVQSNPGHRLVLIRTAPVPCFTRVSVYDEDQLHQAAADGRGAITCTSYNCAFGGLVFSVISGHRLAIQGGEVWDTTPPRSRTRRARQALRRPAAIFSSSLTIPGRDELRHITALIQGAQPVPPDRPGR